MDKLIPNFTGVADDNWIAKGAGFVYTLKDGEANRAHTISVQAFTEAGGAATVTLVQSNRLDSVDDLHDMLDANDAVITATIGADSNDILFSNDVVRCRYTGVYVENVTGTLEFWTAWR